MKLTFVTIIAVAGTKDRQTGTMVYHKSNLLILINFHQNNYIVIEQFHGQ